MKNIFASKIAPITVLIIALFSTVAFAAGGGLSEHFKKFETVTASPADLFKQATARKIVTIGKYRLQLEPSNTRAANFRAEATGADGVSRSIKVDDTIRTFKGTVVGERGSYVRLSINDSIEGYITTRNGRIFIDSARKYSPGAAKNSLVLFQEGDRTQSARLQDVDGGLADGFQMMKARMSAHAPLRAPTAVDHQCIVQSSSIAPYNQQIIEYAWDADAQYLAITGTDVAGARARIEGNLNQMNGIYECELGMSAYQTFTHTWLPGSSDPYTQYEGQPTVTAFGTPTLSGARLLYRFEQYWNETFPHTNLNYRRDVAFLYTGRITNGLWASTGLTRERTVGYATPGHPHHYPKEFAYGWIQSSAGDPSAVPEYKVAAHELAHGIGFTHEIAEDSPEQCANKTQIDDSISFPFFCAATKNQMSGYLLGNDGNNNVGVTTLNRPLLWTGLN